MRKYFIYIVFIFYLVIFSSISLAREVPYNSKDSFLDWGAIADKEVCPDQESYLWVDYDSESGCIRYFSSGNLEGSDTVIIHFYGDRYIDDNKKIQEIKNNKRFLQEGYAKRKSNVLDKPYVVMARPGTYGSSGKHKNKRMKEEFLLLNNAIDNLKKRYSIKNIVVVGHSGGATVGAALLTLGREDIQCAVLSSGTYNYMPREVNRIMSRQKNYDFSKMPKIMGERYDPIFHTEGIYHDESRKVFIVGNEKDKNTPFNLQVSFAWKLISEGHNNTHVITADAEPPMYHNIFNINKYISLCF